MSQDAATRLSALADIIQRFDLKSLLPVLRACRELARADAPLDVAVLGQFKCGKSSLLNVLAGGEIFPVGVLPATAVITRAQAGATLLVHVTYAGGSVEQVDLGRIGKFVTESGNPGNRLGVAVVDVFTPALVNWPGIRLVDTPGLGSMHAHNTRATRDWLPNVAVALVVVSVERPLSEDDRRLVDEARTFAGKVCLILSKVDLLTDDELMEVEGFVEGHLPGSNGQPVQVLRFSSRVGPERWLRHLQETVLQPLVRNASAERTKALAHKMSHLLGACRNYLLVGLQAAQHADADRGTLRTAVLDESVNAALIKDELTLAEQRVGGDVRPAFVKAFLKQQGPLAQRLTAALATEVESWRGHLAQQTRRYEGWMKEQMNAELSVLSRQAAPIALDLLRQAEGRMRRIVEAFRARVGKNIQEAMGVTIAPLAWDVKQPQLIVLPVRIGQTFMTNWDLLWWLLPMRLVGGLFRRHIGARIPGEAEKNLWRLAGDWAAAVNTALADLRAQAAAWVEAELATLDRLLGQNAAEAPAFQGALRQLNNAEATRP